MPLRSKMLALSTIPVVVLIFAVVYAVSAQRTASRTNAEVDRTNTVRQLLAEIQIDLGIAESSVRGYLLTERPGMRADYGDAVTDLRRDLAQLHLHLAEDLQRKRLERLHELVDERLETLRVVLRVGSTETPDRQARLETLLLHGQTITDALRGLTEQMRVTADELVAGRIAARDAAFQRSYVVQILAMPLAVFAAMVLLVSFTAGIVRRVALMRRNAKRLDEGRPLDEPDASRDELGSLSRTLVRTGSHVAELQEELRQLATVDDLTGLANRRGFFALGEHQLLVAARTRAAVALLFVDVDGLKKVNDELGHSMGDLLLKEAAEVLRETIRESDLAGRIGGDEFCVLLMGDPDLDAARAVERVRATTAAHNARRGRNFALSLSIGLSAIPPGRSVTLEELIDAADEGMYEDKRAKQSRQPVWSI
ncbi:MAG TPA: diguanylate cyclase [Actinomycetota bacterium]|nr:diguanylate cyclase [Actinomycetota bacterium]